LYLGLLPSELSKGRDDRQRLTRRRLLLDGAVCRSTSGCRSCGESDNLGDMGAEAGRRRYHGGAAQLHFPLLVEHSSLFGLEIGFCHTIDHCRIIPYHSKTKNLDGVVVGFSHYYTGPPVPDPTLKLGISNIVGREDIFHPKLHRRNVDAMADTWTSHRTSFQLCECSFQNQFSD
jgi:hypothetical protein